MPSVPVPVPHPPVNLGVYSAYYDQSVAVIETVILNGRSTVRDYSFTDRKAEGQKLTSVGKPTTVLGRKWSPCRDYARSACTFTIFDGVTAAQNKTGTVRRIVKGPWYFTDKTRTYRVLGPHCSRGLGLPRAMTANERNRLNTEVLLKVGQRQVNYGESLAESRETVKMLANAASRLLRSVLAARKGQWHKVPKLLGVTRKQFRNGETASQKWLAYQYGWLPMMSDVYDSYELFKKGLLRGPQVFKARRKLTDRGINTKALNNAFREVYGTSTYEYSATVYYRLRDSDLSALHQLGLINPVEVAWAIVPFSFVIDWFLPVGNVLEALSARMGVTFVDGFYGQRARQNLVAKSIVPANATVMAVPVFPTEQSWSLTTSVHSYARQRMNALPWPAPYMKSPFSTSHVTSALALLRQLWRR